MNDNDDDNIALQQENERQPQLQHYLERVRPALERVRRNDPSSWFMSFSDLDPLIDIDAFVDTDLHLSLGQALMASTQLDTLLLSRVVFKTQESAQAVARGIGQSKLTCIQLSDVAASSDAVDSNWFWLTMWQGLQTSQTIVELYVDRFQQRDGIVALGNALPQMHSLRELHMGFKAALDEISAQSLASGLGQSKIESLHLLNMMLFGQAEEITHAWQILGRGLKSMPALQELTLQHVSLIQATTLRDALPLMQSLRRLVFQQWPLTEPIAEALARGISQAKLQSLTVKFSAREKNSGRLWQILFRGLKSSDTIQELTFPSVPSEAVADLVEVMPSMRSLRKLAVSESLDLTMATAESLAKVISQSELETLELLKPINVNMENSENIRQAFYRGLQATQTLKEIVIGRTPAPQLDGLTAVLQSIQTLRISHFGFNQFGELLYDVLVGSTALTRLELNAGNMRSRVGFVSLVQGLCSNTSITSLVLNNCYGSVNRVVEELFTERILDHVSLTHLSVQGCSINDAGVSVLIENWPVRSPIQSLSLRRNEIEATGAQQLIEAFRDHEALQTLDLGSNRVGYQGLRLMAAELVHHQRVTHIMLDDCHSWTHHEDPDSDLAKAQDVARCRAGQALLNCVVQNRNLHHLKVVRNGYLPDIEKQIGFYTSLNRMGRYLLSTHHGLPPTVWCHVFAKCQDPHPFGKSLMFYYLQQQPNLVQPSQFS